MIPIRFDAGQLSLTGNRSINQDRCVILSSGDRLLMALADGLGGHPKGEQAAQILIDTCAQAFRKAPKQLQDPASFLTRTLHLAHLSIVRFGQTQSPLITPRTTAVIAMIHGNVAHWAHVGDSRCYLFRGGRLLTRTIDHSYVERLRSQGIISAAECETHPQRNYLTRCLGGTSELPEIDHGSPVVLNSGDVLLLCSDGFWGPLATTEMSELLQKNDTLESALERLVQDAATTASPESDNVTVAACRWFDGSTEPPQRNKAPTDNRDARDQTRRDAQEPITEAIDLLKQAVADYEDEIKQEPRTP